MTEITEKLKGEMGSDEWWGKYRDVLDVLELELEECIDPELKRKLLSDKKSVLELGAKVIGLLKPGDTNNNFDKALFVIGEKAMAALGKFSE